LQSQRLGYADLLEDKRERRMIRWMELILVTIWRIATGNPYDSIAHLPVGWGMGLWILAGSIDSRLKVIGETEIAQQPWSIVD
jgi:hypothetical protein